MDEQEIADRVGELIYSRDIAAQNMGIKLMAMGPGTATTQLTVTDTMANGHGICHGGIVFSLADCAFAYACNSRNQSSVAASCGIEYLRPGKLGDTLTAVASERAVSARSGFYEVQVANQDNEQIALYNGRSHRFKGKTNIEIETTE